MDAEAILHSIKFSDGSERQLTPKQIASTFERYRDLNYRNQQLAPVNRVIEDYIRNNPHMTPAALAETLTQLAAGQQHNPTMGRGGVTDPNRDGPSERQGAGQNQQQPTAAELKKWAEDNAVSLPPGYEQMFGQMPQMMQMMAQQQQMMRALMAQSGGAVDAARDAQQDARGQQAQAIQRQIANNVDRAQQQLQLPDQAANDFMVFAAERGYGMEDFVDGQLVMQVMNDFKNNMMSPEMERMRALHQRRQSYTGSMGGQSPAGGAPEVPPQQKDFDEFAGRMMEKRRV